MHQHTFLSLIFLLPLVAAFFVFVLQRVSVIGSVLLLAAFFFQLYTAIPRLKELESFWPDSTIATLFLKERVNKQDNLLTESGDITLLALYETVDQDKVFGPYVFEYKNMEGLEAYTSAIDDGYFNYVYLDGSGFNPISRAEIEKSLNSNYSQVFNEGSIVIYSLVSE